MFYHGWSCDYDQQENCIFLLREFSYIHTFIICVTTFVCKESQQSAHGGTFQVCYGQRQGQPEQTSFSFPPNFSVNKLQRCVLMSNTTWENSCASCYLCHVLIGRLWILHRLRNATACFRPAHVMNARVSAVRRRGLRSREDWKRLKSFWMTEQINCWIHRIACSRCKITLCSTFVRELQGE